MVADILSAVGLRKSFGSLHALDDVTLGVAEGKISILIGPNGSGKTTLINVVSGVYKPDSEDLSTPMWAEAETRAIEKASRILELLGLSKLWSQPAYLLSGGQMKLVEIGRALMSDAHLLLLDEPVSGVNPTLAHEIFSRILKLRDETGITFFIVEHRLDIALKYVDNMFAMALGRVIASGTPDDVMNDKRVIDAYLGG